MGQSHHSSCCTTTRHAGGTRRSAGAATTPGLATLLAISAILMSGCSLDTSPQLPPGHLLTPDDTLSGAAGGPGADDGKTGAGLTPLNSAASADSTDDGADTQGLGTGEDSDTHADAAGNGSDAAGNGGDAADSLGPAIDIPSDDPEAGDDAADADPQEASGESSLYDLISRDPRVREAAALRRIMKAMQTPADLEPDVADALDALDDVNCFQNARTCLSVCVWASANCRYCENDLACMSQLQDQCGNSC